MQQPLPRLPRDAGIAIGPILFVLALLAIIGAVIAADPGGFSTSTVTDRVNADVQSQANLIRSKINECNALYTTNNNYDGYPPSPANGELVSALTCEGDPAGVQNVWTGNRATQLPPPSPGFQPWSYINTDDCTPQTGNCLGGSYSGGRCIWTQPVNPSNSFVAGLTKAASKFTHATSSDGTSEVNYNPASASQKFILWITLPTGTPDPHCVP